MPSAIPEIRDVSGALGGRPVLRHIDLKVEEGETVVLLGRSHFPGRDPAQRRSCTR